MYAFLPRERGFIPCILLTFHTLKKDCQCYLPVGFCLLESMVRCIIQESKGLRHWVMAGNSCTTTNSCTTRWGFSQLRSLYCMLTSPGGFVCRGMKAWLGAHPRRLAPNWGQQAPLNLGKLCGEANSLSPRHVTLTPGSGNTAQTHLGRLCKMPGLVGKTHSLLLGLSWIWKPLNRICIMLHLPDPDWSVSQYKNNPAGCVHGLAHVRGVMCLWKTGCYL